MSVRKNISGHSPFLPAIVCVEKIAMNQFHSVVILSLAYANCFSMMIEQGKLSPTFCNRYRMTNGPGTDTSEILII